MALRNGTPVRHVPYGVCDAIDGTNAPKGGMAALINLVPDPATYGVFVPRPAMLTTIDFVAGGFSSPGFISSQKVIGDFVFGTIATARNAGNDEPFAYNMATGAFLTVAGITAANTPTQPPTTGDWTPPILEQIGGSVIVTHSGFPGGATKFGWFDVSGFSQATTVDTNSSTLLTGNPLVLGVQPGMTVTGAGIPANTRVVSTAAFNLATTGNTNSNIHLTNLASTTGVAVGQTVAGIGIPSTATVTAIVSGTAVDISIAATATATGVAITFGGNTITLNNSASASANGVVLTIAGGTAAAPLWGAGDFDRNPLLSVPVGVTQYNGRAYFALGVNGVVYSDSLVPRRASNTIAVQALTTNDGLAVTAVGPLMTAAPLTGQIVQAVVVFCGSTKIYEITGDQAIPSTSITIANGGPSTLSMVALPVATGTDSPLSIAPSSAGLGFVSPQGLRFIKFDGTISKPVGEGGKGVTVPFIFALHPTRTCAAATNDVYRVTVQNGSSAVQATQEWWYDLARDVWTGPHTSAASLIQPWRHTFLVAPINTTAGISQSDSQPGVSSGYTEFSVALTWTYMTSLLPDAGDGRMKAIIEMTLASELSAGGTVTLSAISDFGTTLDTTTIATEGAPILWGGFNWGSGIWGGGKGIFRRRPVNWNIPLVARQMMITATGSSAFNVRVGDLDMLYQRLGYKIEEAA